MKIWRSKLEIIHEKLVYFLTLLFYDKEEVGRRFSQNRSTYTYLVLKVGTNISNCASSR